MDMRLDMHDYTPQAKVYWWGTTLLGTAILALSFGQVAGMGRTALLQIAVGIVAAALTGLYPVRIPGSKTSLAGAEIFIFLLLLLQGPAAATLAAAAEAAVGSWRTSRRWTSRLGSPTMAALSMYGCGTALTLIVQRTPLTSAYGHSALFGALLVFALAYYAASTLMMMSLISLKRGDRIRPLAQLKEDVWIGLAFAASASIAGLVFLSFESFGAPVLLAVIPIIGMFLSTLHFYFRHYETNQRIQQERIESAELRKARDIAEAASRAKSQFLANMSHEIRTPMNGVLGMAELLLGTELSDKQRRFASTIRSSGESLLAVINDILDFSKIEAGKLELEQLDFAPRALLEEMVEMFAQRAQAKGLELVLRVDSSVPAWVGGDPHRLRQILLNLIGNAIKFTAAGEVEVSCRRVATPEAATRLRFAVRDTGIGITAEQRPRLFSAFSQGDGSTTRKFGGTGLGLAIAKELAHLMGGEIGVDSEPGRGATFWFTVAVAGAEAPAAAAAAADDLRGQRLLVVENNPTNRAILEEQARGWGMRVDSVGDGASALALLRQRVAGGEPFGLAVIDMNMPGMNGIELARAIKADTALAALPLVMLTSLGQDGEVAAAREAGIACYLCKPIREQVLRAAIARTLASDGAPEALATALADATPSLGGRVLLAEDNPVNQAVALGMLESLGVEVDVVDNGRQAVDRVATGRYDLVLMDCQMPELDGFGATAEIRRREQNAVARLPIVALTANALDGDREICLAAGMDDYLAKPFTREQIVAVLTRWLSQPAAAAAGVPSAAAATPALARATAYAPAPQAPGSSVVASAASVVATVDSKVTTVTSTAAPPAAGALAAAAPGRTSAGEAINPRALDAIRRLPGTNGPTLVTKVIHAYLADTRPRLAQMRVAIDAGDADALRKAAHAMKSSSANVGADPLAGYCRELEMIGRAGTLDGAQAPLDAAASELERVFAALQAIVGEAAERAQV